MKKARSAFIGDPPPTRKGKPAHGIIPGRPDDDEPKPTIAERVARRVATAAKEAVIDLVEVAENTYASWPVIQTAGHIVRIGRSSPISAEVSDPARRAELLTEPADVLCGYCQTQARDGHRAGCVEAARNYESGCSECGRTDGGHDSDCGVVLNTFGMSEDDYEDIEPRLRFGSDR
jgi:hypothetical protein